MLNSHDLSEGIKVGGAAESILISLLCLDIN